MLVGWINTPLGCTAPGPARGDAQGGVQRSVLKPPLVGGAARFWRRGGNPPAPVCPRRGKRKRGSTKFLAAAGNLLTRHTKNSTRQLSAGNSIHPLKSRNSQLF